MRIFGRIRKAFKDRPYFAWSALVILTAWITVAVLPLLSMFFFHRVSECQQQDIKDILQQYGTFGDAFGPVNSLLGGITVGAAAYFYHEGKQQKEAEDKRRHQAEREAEALKAFQDVVEARRALVYTYTQLVSASKTNLVPNLASDLAAQIKALQHHVTYTKRRFTMYEADIMDQGSPPVPQTHEEASDAEQNG